MTIHVDPWATPDERQHAEHYLTDAETFIANT